MPFDVIKMREESRYYTSKEVLSYEEVYVLLFVCSHFASLPRNWFVITKDSVQPEEAIPGATLETETVTEDQIVINQEVSPAPEKEKEKFYLVSGRRLSACPVSG